MKLTYLFIIIISIAVVGCSSSKNTFYWGNYSATLYDLKKTPDEKTLENHKKEIIHIIEYSKKREKPVPPGIYAEYGYILIKEGQKQEGIEYLNKEIELYPESEILISRIKSEIERGNQ